ncbi:MAG: methyltransferase domain-containing protein [Planctomycetota bacterium]
MSIEKFDIKKYWNDRYAREGANACISRQIYDHQEERYKRDTERMGRALSRAGKMTFNNGIEIGAGSGRLTPFYNSFIRELLCTDISEKAMQCFNELPLKNQYVVEEIKNLKNKYTASFEIAFTFTVVQHINDHITWAESVNSIQEILKPGGYYLLHEDISAFTMNYKPSLHMNGFGLPDYIKALDKCNLIYHEILFEEQTKEHDLVALFERK